MFIELFDSNKIPIVLASDENNAKKMYVTIFSALKNKKIKTFYDFYLLVPRLFEKELVSKFLKLQNKYNCKINFIEMGDIFASKQMLFSHISTPTYYRLKIPDILPERYEKAIYMDTDVIVLKDLTEYFNTDLTDYYIAGVRAAGYILDKRPRNRQYYSEIGIQDMSNYINAGVTLWNLEKIRRDNITSTLIEMTEKNFRSQDQDIINLAFYNHIKTLPLKYNLMITYKKRYIDNNTDIKEQFFSIYTKQAVLDACESPVFIHYIEEIKPWDNRRVWLSEYWWKYAIKSGLYKDNSKHSLISNIFSIRNEGIRKVITILGIKIKYKSKKLEQKEKIKKLNKKVKGIENQIAELKELVLAMEKNNATS